MDLARFDPLTALYAMGTGTASPPLPTATGAAAPDDAQDKAAADALFGDPNEGAPGEPDAISTDTPT